MWRSHRLDQPGLAYRCQLCLTLFPLLSVFVFTDGVTVDEVLHIFGAGVMLSPFLTISVATSIVTK